MKHLIWNPALNEELPNNAVAYRWCERQQTGVDGDGNPVYTEINCEDVVAAVVEDDFVTAGTVRYDSSLGLPPDKPLVHTFAGW